MDARTPTSRRVTAVAVLVAMLVVAAVVAAATTNGGSEPQRVEQGERDAPLVAYAEDATTMAVAPAEHDRGRITFGAMHVCAPSRRAGEEIRITDIKLRSPYGREGLPDATPYVRVYDPSSDRGDARFVIGSYGEPPELGGETYAGEFLEPGQDAVFEPPACDHQPTVEGQPTVELMVSADEVHDTTRGWDGFIVEYETAGGERYELVFEDRWILCSEDGAGHDPDEVC